MTVDGDKVKRAQDGDNAALEEIVNDFMPWLKAYANTYFILGGDKEDVIQEGMLGLFFAVRDYREGLSGFETFAHRCIKARILTALRLAKGKKHTALNTCVELTENDEPLVDDPLEGVLKKEWKETFYKTMENDLSKTERRVVSLYLQGYGYSEISSMTELSVKSVDNALQRGRNKLIRALNV